MKFQCQVNLICQLYLRLLERLDQEIKMQSRLLRLLNLSRMPNLTVAALEPEIGVLPAIILLKMISWLIQMLFQLVNALIASSASKEVLQILLICKDLFNLPEDNELLPA